MIFNVEFLESRLHHIGDFTLCVQYKRSSSLTVQSFKVKVWFANTAALVSGIKPNPLLIFDLDFSGIRNRIVTNGLFVALCRSVVQPVLKWSIVVLYRAFDVSNANSSRINSDKITVWCVDRHEWPRDFHRVWIKVNGRIVDYPLLCGWKPKTRRLGTIKRRILSVVDFTLCGPNERYYRHFVQGSK